MIKAAPEPCKALTLVSASQRLQESFLPSGQGSNTLFIGVFNHDEGGSQTAACGRPPKGRASPRLKLQLSSEHKVSTGGVEESQRAERPKGWGTHKT